jgi:hypothetical protein
MKFIVRQMKNKEQKGRSAALPVSPDEFIG